MLPLAQAALWLSSSDEGKTVFYAAIGFVVGIFLFIRGFRILQRKRLILDTPTAHVRSAAIGLVELTGLAVGPNTITSPITMRPCFYYRTAVWKEVGSGKNRHWEQKVDERFHVPFFLEDQTGMVLVNPHGAEMDIHCDFKAEYNRSMFSSANVPPRVAEFAGRNGVALDDNVRVEEYCLKPRNALYVLGTLATNPGLMPVPAPVPTLGPSADVSKLDWGSGLTSSLLNMANLRINVNVSKPVPTFAPPGPVKLTDLDRKLAERRAAEQQAAAAQKAKTDFVDPRLPSVAVLAAANPAAAAALATVAGTSLPQAVTQSASAAAAQPAKEAPQPVPAEEVVFPEKCPTVLCKGEHNPAFYISWRSQKEIVSELTTGSTLFIFGGPVLSALCLWYLLAYFHAL